MAILLIFASALPSAVSAVDFQLWFEPGIRYKMTKKLALSFEQILRLSDNASKLETVAPELAVDYKLFKFLDIDGGYRFIVEPQYSPGNTQYDVWHRIFFGAEVDKGFDLFTLKYRLRYQEELGWPYGSGDDMQFKHTFRNRFAAECDAGRGFEPFASFELWMRVADNDGVWHKWRSFFGSYLRFSRHRLSLSYGLEGMLNGSDDPLAMILELGYRYSF